MARNILLVDTETGSKHPIAGSLLSVYAAIVHPKTLEIINEKEWKIKPDDGIYRVTAGALAINRIDLVKHTKEAQFATVSSNPFSRDFCDFLWKGRRKDTASNEDGKLQLLGHNVHFDASAISNAIGVAMWDDHVSHRHLDTASISLFFRNVGLLPDEEMNLEKLANHLGIKVHTLHEAKADALLTLEVYRTFRGMLETIKNSK